MCSSTVGVQMLLRETRRSCSPVQAVLCRELLAAENVISPGKGVLITECVLKEEAFLTA
jgi:hypothetical protein